jgi:hypothetical protein
MSDVPTRWLGPGEVYFKPREMPRDLIDVALGLIVTPYILGVIFGVPWLLAWIVLRDAGLAFAVGAGTGVVLGLVVFPLCTVWGAAVGPQGIRFRRWLGSPRRISWDRVQSIEEAPRGELFFYGTFTPWKELSVALSWRQHYRIEYDNGRFYYFPPDDPYAFCEAVRQYRQFPGVMPDRQPPDATLQPVVETGNPYQSPTT